MTWLGKDIVLTGVTQKGKNRVREHGRIWMVLAETDRVLFKPGVAGPWLFVTPSGSDQNHTASRWIHGVSDPDFVIEST